MKKNIYFLLAIDPFTLILAFIELDISLNINMKNKIKKMIFA